MMETPWGKSPPVKFGGHKHCDSVHIMVLFWHVILQDHNPIDTERKLNVLCTFNLCPVFTGKTKRQATLWVAATQSKSASE